MYFEIPCREGISVPKHAVPLWYLANTSYLGIYRLRDCILQRRYLRIRWRGGYRYAYVSGGASRIVPSSRRGTGLLNVIKGRDNSRPCYRLRIKLFRAYDSQVKTDLNCDRLATYVYENLTANIPTNGASAKLFRLSD